MEDVYMRSKVISITVILLTLVLSACGGSVPEVDWTLGVSGSVGSPLALSFAELAEMPQTNLKELLMEKSLGEEMLNLVT